MSKLSDLNRALTFVQTRQWVVIGAIIESTSSSPSLSGHGKTLIELRAVEKELLEMIAAEQAVQDAYNDLIIGIDSHLES